MAAAYETPGWPSGNAAVRLKFVGSMPDCPVVGLGGEEGASFFLRRFQGQRMRRLPLVEVETSPFCCLDDIVWLLCEFQGAIFFELMYTH